VHLHHCSCISWHYLDALAGEALVTLSDCHHLVGLVIGGIVERLLVIVVGYNQAIVTRHVQ